MVPTGIEWHNAAVASACPGRFDTRAPSSTVGRRTVLIGATILATLAATTAACGAPPSESDPLEHQLALARRDHLMARAAGAAANGFWAPVLTVVAFTRGDHAHALATEIARAAGKPLTSMETLTPEATTTAAAAETPAPNRIDVITALRESAHRASTLAVTISGYRAGLLGSIAASCAACVAVPLAMTEPRP